MANQYNTVDSAAFVKALSSFGDKVAVNKDKAIGALSDYVYKNVVERTPVGQPGITSDHPGMARDGWKMDKKIDHTIIYNNVPYINVLEFGGYAPNGPWTTSEGYSMQAPEGMARITYRDTILKAGYIIRAAL